jgi:hypothetical protein
MLATRPREDEYAAFYAGYIARVPDGAWLARLEAQSSEYRAVLAGVDDDRAAIPVAPGKWSPLDVLSHVADTERVFAFRLLWFVRADPSELPGFDHDAWVRQVRDLPRTVGGLLEDLAAVRLATLSLLRGLPDGVADRRGVANGHVITVRALAWVIAGHAQHHLDGLRDLSR